MQMNLPNGCRSGLISVFPLDWEEPTASIKKPWYIHYRFYDTSGKVKQVSIRGMNYERKLKDRRKSTRYLIDQEIERLRNGYNPITGALFGRQQDYIIDPRTPLLNALEKAIARLKIEARTRVEITSMLKHIGKAAKDCGANQLPIKDVRKRHIKMILEQIGKTKKAGKWTANNFNHYRKYLSMVFSELVEVEALEFNPVKQIAKQKTTSKVRVTLTLKERKKINLHLMENYYRFWLFMQCFFHSGSREAELLRVKGKDVNIKDQYVKVTIIKGKERKEVRKTIKNVALSFWKEAVKGCSPDSFVFGKGLKPALKPIRPEQITRRWRTHVKQKLGIDADLYSLKHSNTDDLARMLSMDEARKHNSHTSKKTTLIYAIGEEARQHERIKKVGNKFA